VKAERVRMNRVAMATTIVTAIGIVSLSVFARLLTPPVPGFPEDQTQLIAARDASTTVAASPQMNGHAWALFKQLVLGQKSPLWSTWCAVADDAKGATTLVCPKKTNPHPPGAKLTDIQLLEAESERRNLTQFLLSARSPRQLEDGSQQLDSSNGPDPALLQASMVLFDPDSADSIKKCFRTGLDMPLDNGNFIQVHLGAPHQNAECKSFDLSRSAIAIKTIWVMAAHDRTDERGRFLSRLIPSLTNKTKVQLLANYPTLGPLNGWGTRASVSLLDKSCDSGKSFDPDPGAAIPYSIVPLGCFYSLPATERDIKAAAKIVHIPISSPSGVPDDMTFDLVLMEFHVATREIEGWTWQTYAWNGSAPIDMNPNLSDINPASTASTGDPNSRWSHYTMQTTFGNLKNEQMPSVAYGAYLEGIETNGVKSNCFTCHNYAAYHPDSNLRSCKHTRQEYFDAAQLLGRGLPPSPDTIGTTDCTITPATYALGEPVKTAFLWSIADSKQGGVKNFLEVSPFLSRLNNYLHDLDERSKQHISDHHDKVPAKQ
jgi:hypothetical protein